MQDETRIAYRLGSRQSRETPTCRFSMCSLSLMSGCHPLKGIPLRARLLHVLPQCTSIVSNRTVSLSRLPRCGVQVVESSGRRSEDIEDYDGIGPINAKRPSPRAELCRSRGESERREFLPGDNPLLGVVDPHSFPFMRQQNKEPHHSSSLTESWRPTTEDFDVSVKVLLQDLGIPPTQTPPGSDQSARCAASGSRLVARTGSSQ